MHANIMQMWHGLTNKQMTVRLRQSYIKVDFFKFTDSFIDTTVPAQKKNQLFIVYIFS